jgi:acyl-CoA thioester hydrolase
MTSAPGRVTTPREGRPFQGWDPVAPIPAPLAFHKTEVPEAWTDYNGHMSESAFLLAFGDSSDAFFRYIGIDEAYHRAGLSYYTVETHIMHLREVEAGVPLHVTTQLLSADDKRIHLFHSLHRSDDGARLATAEQMLLHVDTNASRACPAREDVRERVLRIAKAHRGLPKPDFAGRQVGAPRH